MPEVQTLTDDTDRGLAGVSRFEFLDDEDRPLWPMPPQMSTGLAAPAAGGTNSWAALDNDYRPIPRAVTNLPLGALLHPRAAPEAVAQRIRFEFPVLVTWFFLSATIQGGVAWMVIGLILVGYSFVMRDTFALYRFEGAAGIYRAVGAGQAVGGLAGIVDLSAFAPVLGMYALGVMFSWIYIECRYMYRMENMDDQIYDTVSY
ncbi:MAG TPA: hypothetical protein VM536_02875 [Chloroflexia bacterium]|nr:hypothetical protein [Chloroflexia bacterium]